MPVFSLTYLIRPTLNASDFNSRAENLLWCAVAQAQPRCDNHQTKELPVKQHGFHTLKWLRRVIFSLTLDSADCLMTSSKIYSIYKIFSSLTMTHKLLFSDLLEPYMKINFILWGSYGLHDCSPIYRWTEKQQQKTNKNIYKSPTSCHGEEYHNQEHNPRLDQALFSHCFRGVTVRQVELKSVI